jgi:Spy/CpxP family protein refolding chaperone
MKMNRMAKQLAAGACLFFLCAMPGRTRAQSAPPAPVPTPPKAIRPTRMTKETGPMDDFAGLNFTDDQKERINKIHEDFKARLDAVIKDDKLNPDQKGAMLQGFQRMERGEVYKVLTREQQAEVRKRILARRAAAQKEQQERKTQPTPTPHAPTQQPARPVESSKPPQPPLA